MHTLLFLMGAAMASDVYDRVEHGYADSNGVKIHYASLGKGPLVVQQDASELVSKTMMWWLTR